MTDSQFHPMRVIPPPPLPANPFWLCLWACVLSVGWLISRHRFPWGTVHADTWIAILSSVASLVVIWSFRKPMVWHRITLLAALLLCIPWLQVALGMVPVTGVAWISTAYLLGLVLALLTGAHWEEFKPGQMADGLFLAIGIAAIISVGLQLQQWLQLGSELGKAVGGVARPDANLGQPNQLATLLLWGILAAAWGSIRGYMKPRVAVFMALYLLMGVALTASRTAWIAVVLLLCATWWWRNLWGSLRTPWVVMGLGAYFVLCNVLVVYLPAVLHLKFVTADGLSGASAHHRLLAWAVFADAVWQKPLLGYGWNQTAVAQMAVAAAHPAVRSVFSFAHNLFLDLVIWCGIPLGLFVSGSLLRWFWLRFRAVQSAENAVLVLFLLVVANHAMLEFPLYYAYFLLPVGLVMGMVNVRLGAPPVISMGVWFSRAISLATIALLALIIRDYRRIEPSYRNLLFDAAAPIAKVVSKAPPDVLLLTQWRDYIEFAWWQPKAGATAEELDRMRHITEVFPSTLFIYKLAYTLALNQRSDEARVWLPKLCKVVSDEQCQKAQTLWAQETSKHPELASIAWPTENNE
jgi:O-antigen ligase